MAAARLALAFGSLVTIQTASNLLFKAVQRNGAYNFNPAAQMVIAELLKLSISLLLLWRAGMVNRPRAVPNVPLRTLASYAVLACGYAANNQLTYLIITKVNPGLLSIAKSSTPLLIAVISSFFFNERLTTLQWQCVVLQVCGMAALFSNNGAAGEDGDCSTQGTCDQGVRFIALACALTAGCSSLNSHLLHQNSSLGLHGQNALLYAFGVAMNSILYAIGLTPSQLGFFVGHFDSLSVILLLLSNAFVGLLVTFVYRFGNAVVKTMAMSVSSSLLLLLPIVLSYGASEPDTPLRASPLQTASSCIVVLVAALIYLESPPPQSQQRSMSAPASLWNLGPSNRGLGMRGGNGHWF